MTRPPIMTGIVTFIDVVARMSAHCSVLRQARLVQTSAAPEPKAGHSSLNFTANSHRLPLPENQPGSPALCSGWNWDSQAGRRCCPQGSRRWGSATYQLRAFVGRLLGNLGGNLGSDCWLGTCPQAPLGTLTPIFQGTFLPSGCCCTLPLDFPLPPLAAPQSCAPPPDQEQD